MNNKFDDNQNKIDRRRWIERISPYIGAIGIILSAIYFSVDYFSTEKPNLTYDIITKSSLINLKNNDIEINFEYDSLKFSSKKDQISLIVIEIKNLGDKNILIKDFDKNFPFGLRVSNAQIIEKPEIIGSSNLEYFQDIIKKYNLKRIDFKKKIIDKGESFKLKFYLAHTIGIYPEIKPIGKITGQKSFKIIKAEDINNILEKQKKSIKFTQMTTGLSIVLIIILSLLTLSLYKNNNLRAKANELLREKIIELQSTLDKMKKSKD